VTDSDRSAGRADPDRPADRPHPDALAWETLDRETAYRCGGFSVRRERVRLPDGTETDFDAVVEPDAAVVLPLTPDGEVVVVDEWRQAVGRVARGLPAGTIEADEEPAAGARRELAEETGYAAESIEHLRTDEPANGLLDARHHAFLATGCRPTATPDHDADETIRVTTVPYEEFHAQVVDGHIDDGRSVIAVLGYEAVRDADGGGARDADAG
jgi:ADP-ribose pyrophosphatase